MKKVPEKYFDEAFYSSAHPDVAAAGLSPMVHFCAHGMNENRVYQSDYSLVLLYKKELEPNKIDLTNFLKEAIHSKEKQKMLEKYRKLNFQKMVDEIKRFESDRHAVQHCPDGLIGRLSPLCKQFKFKENGSSKPRLNIFLPTVNSKKIFGGISTALAFFNTLRKKLGMSYDYRIIAVDDAVTPQDVEIFKKFQLARLPDDGSHIVVSGMERNRRTISWRKNELSIVTFWTTFYSQFNELKRLRTEGKNTRMIYFIQDYEPNFYNVSSESAMCDETYHNLTPKDFAIFNSTLLKSYFDMNGYRFSNEYVFDPVINHQVKQNVTFGQPRRNHLLFYARRNPRNLLNVGLLALDIFKTNYPQLANDLQVFGVGNDIDNYQFSDGSRLVCRGNLSLPEYGRALSTAKTGLSLMMAPHPSYPPLEMAYSGLRVVTNDFKTKKMNGMHDNIVSVTDVSPENIANAIATQVKRSNEEQIVEGKAFSGSLKNFAQGHNPFQQIINNLVASL